MMDVKNGRIAQVCQPPRWAKHRELHELVFQAVVGRERAKGKTRREVERETKSARFVVAMCGTLGRFTIWDLVKRFSSKNG